MQTLIYKTNSRFYFYIYVVTLVPMPERSEARTVFDRSNTGIVV